MHLAEDLAQLTNEEIERIEKLTLRVTVQVGGESFRFTDCLAPQSPECHAGSICFLPFGQHKASFVGGWLPVCGRFEQQMLPA